MRSSPRAALFAAIALLVPSALLLSACGSSDGESSEQTNVAPQATVDESSDETTADTASDTSADTTVEAAPSSAASVVRVSGGSTEAWEIAGNCIWTPDNTGAASSLYVVEDIDDSAEEEITILEAWPMSLEDDSETVIIGSIIEPGGNLLTVLDVEPSFDGETITLMTDVHNGIKTFDDPPDFTLTITCGP